MKYLKFCLPGMLAAALLLALAACRTQPAATTDTPQPTAATVPAVPTPSPAPTATPVPTAPSDAIQYTAMPVRMEPNPLPSFASATYDFMRRDSIARQNGYELIAGLYTGDAARVEAVLSDQVLEAGNPLADLTGLVMGDVFLAGGTYDIPLATLTVIDPGVTPLLLGTHTYYWKFDEQGKVRLFTPYDVTGDMGETGVLQALREQFNLSSNIWQPVGTLRDWDNTRGSEVITMGKMDALHMQATDVRAFRCEWEQTADGDETLLQAEECPGPWPAAVDRYETLAVPPAGNALSQEQLQAVAGQLNDQFARLQAGSFRPEYADLLTSDRNVDYNLDGWDAALPLPVEVQPTDLRSRKQETLRDDGEYEVWVPLPERHWALFRYQPEDGSVQKMGYCCEAPIY